MIFANVRFEKRNVAVIETNKLKNCHGLLGRLLSSNHQYTFHYSQEREIRREFRVCIWKISKSEEGKVEREGRRKKSVATRKDVKLSLCRIRGKRRYLPVRWIRIREGSRGEDPSREYPTCLVFKVIDPRVPR